MLRNLFSRFARDERGVTLVEYGIGVTLAIIVGVVLLATLGEAINLNLVAASDAMTGCSADPTTGIVTCPE